MHSGTLMHKGWFLGCGNWRDTQTGGGSSGPGRDVTAREAVVTETERSELGKESWNISQKISSLVFRVYVCRI